MKAGWRQQQRGATFLGVLIIGGILAVGLYVGMRMVPMYSEYLAVSKALTQIAAQGGDESATSLKNLLQRRWDIDDIKSIPVKDIEITKLGNGMQIRAAYRAEAPLMGNVSLVIDFDKTVTTGASTKF